MLRPFLFSAIVSVFLSSSESAIAASPTPSSGDLRITLRRPALLGLMASATPYAIQIGGNLISETLTFTEPKDLSFQEGKISFAVRCRGTPFPLDQVLRPVLVVKEAGAGGGYRVAVESLPLAVPGLGTVDLKDFFQPIEIESLLRQSFFLQGRPAWVEVQVRRIALRPEQIDLDASIHLTKDRKR